MTLNAGAISANWICSANDKELIRFTVKDALGNDVHLFLICNYALEVGNALTVPESNCPVQETASTVQQGNSSLSFGVIALIVIAVGLVSGAIGAVIVYLVTKRINRRLV